MNVLYTDVRNIVNDFSMNHESELSNQCYDFLDKHSYISKNIFDMIWHLHIFRLSYGYLNSRTLEKHWKMLEKDLKNLQKHGHSLPVRARGI